MEKEESNNNQKMEEQQNDDLDDLPDLFHKSSLKERTDPQLPIITDQIFSVKKVYDNNNNTQIHDYRQIQIVGKGAFGSVTKVQKVVFKQDIRDSQPTGQYFAMKGYNKNQLRGQRFFAPDGDFADALEMLDNQINIVRRMQHPNIVACHKILYSSDKIYMVMQLCDLGQIMRWNQLQLKYVRNDKVFSYICKKYGVNHKADVTRIIFMQVCQATKYMHDKNITNRDIKVDNILCKSDTKIGQQIKVADFTTVRYNNDDISYFPSGTPGFRGPQHQFASSQGYSCKSSDIWSIGYSMYVYYHQIFPFFGQTQLEIDIKAKNQPLKYQQGSPQWLSKSIQRMCDKDWKKRVDINKAIQMLKGNQS